MIPSSSHLVLIPSFNPGPRLETTLEEALVRWSPVWVVDDGSTDGSAGAIAARAARDPRVRLISRPANGGKGAAVETGARAARAAGFTHALVMDADGQHPSERIADFMEASRRRPEALVLGRPLFGPEAPAARRQGRKISTALARLEVLGGAIADPLFGFRVYPLAALERAFAQTRWARRFDFDHEIAVRMVWAGTPTVNLPAACRYLGPGEGGVSHFRYGRDNLLLAWLHFRLLGESILGRWAGLLRRRRPASLALLAFGLLAAGARAKAAAPPAAGESSWRALVARLHPGRDRTVPFEERRYFPFRRAPIELTGIVRIAPGRGLSLDYAWPERRIVVIDRQGILVRSPDGAQRSPPSDPRVRAATEALAAVLNFDPAELERDFTVSYRPEGAAWDLELSPRNPDFSGVLESIGIEGRDGRLRRIDLVTSPEQKVEILLGPPREAPFDAAQLRRYFR